MKKIVLAVVFVLILITAASAGVLVGRRSGKSDPANQKSSLKRICPDEWIENQMPGPDQKDRQSQYFSIDGKRQELKDYDIEWIKANCSVKEPSPVY